MGEAVSRPRLEPVTSWARRKTRHWTGAIKILQNRCQRRIIRNTSVSNIGLCFKPDILYYLNMQNDRNCVSDSQPSLNRSTNNCPVVTGNCRCITETCGLAIRTTNCLACKQELGTGHNELGKAPTASLLTARHTKTRTVGKMCIVFVYDSCSKRFWPYWTFCKRLVFYAELRLCQDINHLGVDQIPEQLIQSGDGRTLHSKINKPINVILSTAYEILSNILLSRLTSYVDNII